MLGAIGFDFAPLSWIKNGARVLSQLLDTPVIFDNHFNNLSLIMNEDGTKEPILKLFP